MTTYVTTLCACDAPGRAFYCARSCSCLPSPTARRRKNFTRSSGCALRVALREWGGAGVGQRAVAWGAPHADERAQVHAACAQVHAALHAPPFHRPPSRLIRDHQGHLLYVTKTVLSPHAPPFMSGGASPLVYVPELEVRSTRGGLSRSLPQTLTPPPRRQVKDEAAAVAALYSPPPPAEDSDIPEIEKGFASLDAAAVAALEAAAACEASAALEAAARKAAAAALEAAEEP